MSPVRPLSLALLLTGLTAAAAPAYAAPAPSDRTAQRVAALSAALEARPAPGAALAMPAPAPAPAGVATDARYQAAFQANTGSLFRYAVPGGPADFRQGMAPGTSPSTAEVPGGGYQSAFQANNGNLIVFGRLQNLNTGQGMAPGTSPSISVAADGSFEVAFQANNGRLYAYSSVTGPRDVGLAMAPRTSPSTRWVGYSDWFTAYQAPNGALQVQFDGSPYDTLQGMAEGTSPSLAATPREDGYDFQVSFQANNNLLYTYREVYAYDAATDEDAYFEQVSNTLQGMKPGTSPAVVQLTDGRGYETAFQANTGELVFQGAVGANSRQGMLAGTSPAIVATAGGGWVAAFQANNTALYTYSTRSGPANTQQGMLPGTSPSIG